MLEVAPVGVAFVVDAGSAAALPAVAAAVAVAGGGATVVAAAVVAAAVVAEIAAEVVVVPKRAVAAFHLDVDRLFPVVLEARAADAVAMNYHWTRARESRATRANPAIVR